MLDSSFALIFRNFLHAEEPTIFGAPGEYESEHIVQLGPARNEDFDWFGRIVVRFLQRFQIAREKLFLAAWVT